MTSDFAVHIGPESVNTGTRVSSREVEGGDCWYRPWMWRIGPVVVGGEEMPSVAKRKSRVTRFPIWP